MEKVYLRRERQVEINMKKWN